MPIAKLAAFMEIVSLSSLTGPPCPSLFPSLSLSLYLSLLCTNLFLSTLRMNSLSVSNY